MSYKVFDIETTTHTSFKRKGNPFDARNHVVTYAYKAANTKVEEHRFGSQRPGPGWFKQVLQGTRLLVGFNIKFDLLYALQDADNLAAWMEYVAGGGNVWDCQLAEYLLDGQVQGSQILSLEETAPRYGGNVKLDEVKALWAAGVQTTDIEPALLTRYLCGGEDEHGQWQEGDIGNTEKVFLGQLARARDAKQVNSIMLNMGSLLCTVEMERNGMFVDVATGYELAAELSKKIEELKVALNGYLPADLPFEFKWTSRHHKSALIFGGAVPYDSYQYDLADGTTIDKRDYDAAETKPARVYAKKTIKVDTGEVYKSGKNAGEKKFRNEVVPDTDKPKGRQYRTTYTFTRITAPNDAWKTSEPGVWSTASDVLEGLGNRNIPFLKAISEFAASTKDLGTYFIVEDPETGERKGMLSLVDALGIIHHGINHTSTVTARFSSSNPNLFRGF